MSWSYVLCRTRDGVRVNTVEPVGPGSWVRRLASKGSGSHAFAVTGEPEIWQRAARPTRLTLVVCWEGDPVYAGLIWKATYSRTAGTVTVDHADIWSLWDKRLAIPQFRAAEDPALRVIETRVKYSNLSLRTQIKRAVQMGMVGPVAGLAEYELPLVLPADQSGSSTLEYFAFDMLTVTEAISRILDDEDSPFLDFAPRWNSSTGALEWVMRTFFEPTGDVVLHASAPDSPVTDVSVTVDGEEFSTEVHGTGEGTADGTLHRRRWLSGDASNDLVALAHHEAMSEVKASSRLARLVAGVYRERGNLVRQIDCNVSLLGENPVSPHRLPLGTDLTLKIYDDPVLTDGEYRQMVIGYKPNGPFGLSVELTSTPTPVAGTSSLSA